MTIKTTNLIFRDMFDFINLYGVIYEIKNLINSKRYIGQTIKNNLNGRCRFILKSLKNAYKRNAHLISSLELYGIENFERNIIDFAENKEELDKKEEFYIQKHDTLNPDKGYNLKHGGSNGKPTIEIRKKMSKSKKGKYKGENNPRYGKHHTDETKVKISKKLEGRKNPEHSKRMKSENNPRYGKHHSEETKQKLSKTLKKSKKHKEAMTNPQTIKKMSESHKGKKFSIKTRKKMSDARKGKPRSEETKRKISESHIKNTKNRKRLIKQMQGKNNINYRSDLEYITRDFLIQEYWGSEYNTQNRILDPKQKSAKQISTKNNCSEAFIIEKMKNFKISIKTRSEAAKLRYMKK